MDQKNFTLLCRKLEALNYSDPLDRESAPLVQKLVDDLVHTTESYRGLKLRSAKQGQESEQWQSKVLPSSFHILFRRFMSVLRPSPPSSSVFHLSHPTCVSGCLLVFPTLLSTLLPGSLLPHGLESLVPHYEWTKGTPRVPNQRPLYDVIFS